MDIVEKFVKNCIFGFFCKSVIASKICFFFATTRSLRCQDIAIWIFCEDGSIRKRGIVVIGKVENLKVAASSHHTHRNHLDDHLAEEVEVDHVINHLYIIILNSR